MLRELRIKNFAIVDKLGLSFEEGLNVITGETGAGKSLVVDAVELVLGGRASSESVRAGADEAWIEAFFEIKNSLLLDSIGIACDEGVIVKRVVSRTGRSRAYINDSLVTIQTLSAFGKDLVDLHGQHEHQSLLSPAVQRGLVDSFGRLDGPVKEVGKLHDSYRTMLSTITDIKEKARERAQRIDLLRYQIAEIDAAGLQGGEDVGLREEKAILSNLTHLRYLGESAFSVLKDEDGSVLEKLGMLLGNIEELSQIDASAAEVLKVLRDADSLLQDAASSLREIKERYDCEPQRLEDVESRLALIEDLQRKYGETVDSILDYREKAAAELEDLEGLEERGAEIEDELEKIHSALMEEAGSLSRERKKTARRIEGMLKEVLSELAFSHPDFRIEVAEIPITATGIDRVDFLFSANPGQPPRPLSKVASGGELSRLMLALKSVFADVDRVPVLVFDEVDAGVGGQTAESVGERLRRLSERHQVICITHLPQIASRADFHLLVIKEEEGEGVAVTVRGLDRDERVREIARMLSGSVTGPSLRHAEELLRKKRDEGR
ncbi:DNA repair protein RecN [hydrothermal vent metagenome]|uniref:DNA repair protein RecN n=1 Tax=hydrothermal vent metagenome TaxID=652676 RepID=A0A3B1D0H9_9ZZZZ